MKTQGNELTVEQMNEMIAIFMDLYKSEGSDFSGQDREMWFDKKTHIRKVDGQLKYHISWDWIMPVVKKILHEVNAINSEVGLQEALLKCDLSAVHLSVYKFIKWYSQDGI